MLKRKKQIIAKVMATTMLATTLATTFVTTAEAASVGSTTIAGSDRYETAIKISENGWSSATNAVLINGEKGLVDALTATPYASLKDAPILITNQDNLTTSTLNRLKAMKVKHVDIVGGVNSVSDKVVSQLKSNGMTVNRISGSSRYETGLAVAKEIDKISNISKIAVVNGEKGLPDAVSVAAPAADNKMPIILAHPTNGIDAATKTFINGEGIYKSYVIGSTSSMPDSIANTLPGTKTRLGGSDRHDTNAKVIKEFYPQTSLDNIYVAKSGHVVNENELVDALAAGVLAAKNDDPVLLAGKTLGTTQESMLKEKKFTKMTQIGGNIPTATLNSIKATQEDPEAQVSSVSLVNYKTIKLTGKELNRIDRSKVSISGNTTTSYSVNSAGTEATVEFSNAFDNGTNTVKVTSNLGKVTSYTFRYNTEVSTVEATTREVDTQGIQYLEFTVNSGQKRTIEELKALGWTVEFRSSKPIFYKLSSGSLDKDIKSSDGQLQTKEAFNEGEVYDYEVVLKKGTTEIKSGKRAFEVKNKVNSIKEIKSYETTFGTNGSEKKLNSSTLLVGEKMTVESIKVINSNGSESTRTPSQFSLESSNPNVLTVKTNGVIEAREQGSSQITLSVGDITKKFTVSVKNKLNNERKVNSATFNPSSIRVLNGNSSVVTITIKDQYGDPMVGETINSTTGLSLSAIKNSSGTPIASTSILTPVVSDKKGEYTTTITGAISATSIQSGTLKVQNEGKDITGSLSVSVSPVDSTTPNYKVEISSTSKSDDFTIDKFDKTDNELDLVLNKYIRNDYLAETGVSLTTTDNKYTVESSNKNIATATIETSGTPAKDSIAIRIGNETGNVQIKLFDKDKKQVGSTITVVVNDTTPKLSSIKLNTILDINEPKESSDVEFSLLDLFDAKKISIDGSSTKTVVNKDTVSIDGTLVAGEDELLLDLRSGSDLPVLFIDKKQSNKFNGTYDENVDQLIATIDMTTDGTIVNASSNPKAEVDIAENAKDQKGNIIVRIYNGTYGPSDTGKSVFASRTIKVNISE